MDARFHELTEPEKGTARHVGFEAWVMLFLLMFAGNYLTCSMAVEFILRGCHEFLVRLAGMCFILGMFAGWPAVIHYKIRALFPIRCVSFIASVAAYISVASHFHQSFLDSGIPEHDPFITWTLVVMGLFLMPVIQMEITTFRAKYLYSEKTEQWLRYWRCTARRRLVVEPEKPLPETVEDVLALEIAGKKWRDISQFGLFLDSVPDGEHYFHAAFPNKQKFFSLKFSRPKTAMVLLRIDWRQVRQLRGRFGEFKKMRSIPVISARAGNELRLRRKRESE